MLATARAFAEQSPARHPGPTVGAGETRGPRIWRRPARRRAMDRRLPADAACSAIGTRCRRVTWCCVGRCGAAAHRRSPPRPRPGGRGGARGGGLGELCRRRHPLGGADSPPPPPLGFPLDSVPCRCSTCRWPSWRTYRPSIEQPEDLAEFWRRSREEMPGFRSYLSVRPVENKLAVIDTFDVRSPVGAELRCRLGCTCRPGHAVDGPTADRCPVLRVLARPRVSAREHRLGPGRLGAADDGHPRSGLAHGWTEHTADWAPEAGVCLSRFPDRRHGRSGELLLPAGLRRRDAMLDVVAGLDVTDPDRVIVTGSVRAAASPSPWPVSPGCSVCRC